jgi:hypothetical protein
MPYIPKKDRIHTFPSIPAESVGELNYRICREIDQYCQKHGVKYATFNDVFGVLLAVAQELNRRFVGPYEDKKLAENGEVFHFLASEIK